MAYTTIDDPLQYFNTVLFTGNGSTQSITGVGFQPDWVWIKNRGATTNYEMADVVRGANKLLKTNATDTEQDLSTKITSFDSDGFGVGNDANVNQSSTNIVSWNWLAGGSTSSNGDGSITSTVSANTTAGFSIVSYTGTGSNATVGHGLGVAPSMIIVKSRSSTDWWITYHKSVGATKYVPLNFQNAAATNSGIWNDTEPSSSVFSIGTNGGTNGSSNNYIAYCFSEKKGYSRFGSYTGNGNSNGAFVYTGFRPAFIIFRRTNGTGNWQLLDNKRTGFNPENHTLYPNSAIGDQDETDADIFSNGFRLTNTGTDGNGSGDTYLYMAFAHSPLVNSKGVPNNAR